MSSTFSPASRPRPWIVIARIALPHHSTSSSTPSAVHRASVYPGASAAIFWGESHSQYEALRDTQRPRLVSQADSRKPPGPRGERRARLILNALNPGPPPAIRRMQNRISLVEQILKRIKFDVTRKSKTRVERGDELLVRRVHSVADRIPSGIQATGENDHNAPCAQPASHHHPRSPIVLNAAFGLSRLQE